jgi:hypothetical protein
LKSLRLAQSGRQIRGQRSAPIVLALFNRCKRAPCARLIQPLEFSPWVDVSSTITDEQATARSACTRAEPLPFGRRLPHRRSRHTFGFNRQSPVVSHCAALLSWRMTMPNSPVEREAFRPRFEDHPDCPRLTNGLHPVVDHCLRCFNALRAKPKPYRIRDYNGRIISDWLM